MYDGTSLEDKLDIVYPLMTEFTGKIFRNLLNKPDFILPKLIKPKEVGRSESLNYYPYHYKIIHPIEDYIIFKN